MPGHHLFQSGYNLVQFCIANNIRITSVPGPSSLCKFTAIWIANIKFAFFGFVPKSKKDRRSY